ALNSGGTAVYSGGSGTTTLSFTYAVGLGDFAADLDYASTGALTVPAGSSINDQASGTAIDRILPAPGAAGSLGANKDPAVDDRPDPERRVDPGPREQHPSPARPAGPRRRRVARVQQESRHRRRGSDGGRLPGRVRDRPVVRPARLAPGRRAVEGDGHPGRVR